MNVPCVEQFTGCLIGECLGDAIGLPMEGRSHATCRCYVEDMLKAGRAGELAHEGFAFGQYTDDSQLARELLESFVACQRFDPEDYARRIAVIFKERRVVGEGIATAEAARRLAAGVPWQDAGSMPPSAGNGSAMRAAPVGLMFYDDWEQLVRVADMQGRITHQDRRCSAGAVAVAAAAAYALTNDAVDAEALLTRLSECCAPISEPVAAALLQLIEWMKLPPSEAVYVISKAGISPRHSDGWEHISPFVTSSVLWSLYAFLRSPEDYWETICTAIFPGGDVDTTAAMAGAISGAHLGIQAIPADLAERLTDQGTWGYGELVELARKSHQLKMRWICGDQEMPSG